MGTLTCVVMNDREMVAAKWVSMNDFRGIKVSRNTLRID